MKILLLSLAAAIGLLCSCEKKDEMSSLEKKEISGYVQKGPFQIGSTVTVFELDAKLTQTGKTYTAIISDNSGKWLLENVSLISPYVLLKADGFYFNENLNVLSQAPITLNAIADISDLSSVNVNVITHLTYQRIQFLMKNNNLAYADARKKAESEILKMLYITSPEMSAGYTLNFFESGDQNGVLLAVSAILQGFRSASETSALLSSIASDMREDGELNNAIIGETIKQDISMQNISKIGSNIIAYCNSINKTISLPEYSKYIEMFLTKSPYKPKFLTYFPISGIYGLNILNYDVDTIYSGILTTTTKDGYYSMTANLPAGSHLKVVVSNGLWMYSVGSVSGWSIDSYSMSDKIQTFNLLSNNGQPDIKLKFTSNQVIKIEYYFNNSPVPNKVKFVTVI